MRGISAARLVQCHTVKENGEKIHGHFHKLTLNFKAKYRVIFISLVHNQIKTHVNYKKIVYCFDFSCWLHIARVHSCPVTALNSNKSHENLVVRRINEHENVSVSVSNSFLISDT